MKIACVVLNCIVLACLACGCLSVERKEYHYQLNADGESGKATVMFVNIFSNGDDSATVAKDFAELVNDYIGGVKVDSLYPDVSGIHKRLYESNGKLNGEVSFTFSHLTQAFLYRYDAQSPVMQFFDMINEKYITSNGKFGGAHMPVMFWKNTSHDLTLTTTVAEDTGSAHSLLPEYTAWQKNH